MRWQRSRRPQLSHAPQPPRRAGNRSLLCLFTDEAGMLTLETEQPLTQSRAALLRFETLSLPAGRLLLPPLSSPDRPARPCWVTLLPCFCHNSDPIPQRSTSSRARGASQALPGRLHGDVDLEQSGVVPLLPLLAAHLSLRIGAAQALSDLLGRLEAQAHVTFSFPISNTFQALLETSLTRVS